MERLITFCVLLCLSSLVASLPFPDPFPEAYAEPGYGHPQYENFNEFAQPHNSYVQRPQYRNVNTYRPAGPSFGGNSYGVSSNTARNYPGQNYLVSNGPSEQQIQEQIQEQIKEQQAAINERLASQIRSQTVQANQNLLNVAKPYINTPRPNGQLKPAFIYEQQLPAIDSPTHQWEHSPVNEYEHGTIAEAHAVSYPEPEPVPQHVNPYKQIYHHLLQEPRIQSGNKSRRYLRAQRA